MIIDCHGHYTTAPGDLQIFRDAQIANFEGSSNPAPRLADISDDAIWETIENNQLRALRERAAATAGPPGSSTSSTAASIMS